MLPENEQALVRLLEQNPNLVEIEGSIRHVMTIAELHALVECSRMLLAAGHAAASMTLQDVIASNLSEAQRRADRERV